MQKTIEITTTQNVTIEYELAKLRDRIFAWLLDAMVLLFGYAILFGVFFYVFASSGMEPRVIGALSTVVVFLSFFLYHALFEIWNMGQSLGKIAMGIKVVRLDGKDPEWSDVVLRALMHLIDTIFSLSAIGVLLIKTTGKSQRLGDMAANTTVIKIQGSRFQFRLQDILNISSLENYQPTFPQVRNLNERDMIFIKNVLTRLQRYPNQAHEEVVEDLVTHLMPILGIQQRPLQRVEFLKTLLRDYIVLTR